jgi:hypothetical protein
MKTTHYVVLVLFLLALSGCITPGGGGKDPKPTPDPSKTIKPIHDGMTDASKALEGSTDTLSGSAKAVRAGAKGAEDGAVAGDVDRVRKEADNLRNTADEIDNEVLELSKVHSQMGTLIKQLQTADVQSADLKKMYERCRKDIEKAHSTHEAQIKDYEAQIAEISSERDAALQKVLLGLIVGSIVIIGICVAAAINGSTQAMSCAGAAIICLIIANTMRKHDQVFAGGVAIAICVGLMIYKVWRHRRAEQALEETVHSVEAVKESLTDADKAKIFGHGAMPGALHGIQSPDTMKLVNEKRLRIKPKIEHTLT